MVMETQSKYKIFIITIDDNRYKKYKQSYLRKNPIYEKWKGCIGKNLTADFVDNTYITMWNANRTHKHNVAGCSESHLSLMKHIIENKLNTCIVCEDDIEIDLNRINELDNINNFCYIGGHFQNPVLSRKIKKDNITLDNGINNIDIKQFTIAGGYGYYYPTWKVCEYIYNLITNKKKRRAIDAEFRILQKKQIITKFIYPAIVTLYLPEAKNGFTYRKGSYKLIDNYYRYNHR